MNWMDVVTVSEMVPQYAEDPKCREPHFRLMWLERHAAIVTLGSPGLPQPLAPFQVRLVLVYMA
jgi:hypothetical protein